MLSFDLSFRNITNILYFKIASLLAFCLRLELYFIMRAKWNLFSYLLKIESIFAKNKKNKIGFQRILLVSSNWIYMRTNVKNSPK